MPILSNARHEKFAQCIVSGLDQTAAYTAAGYQGSSAALMANASRLIRADKIRVRIDELSAAAVAVVERDAGEAVASAAWIISESVKLYARCMQVEAVLTGKGEPTGYYTFDSGGANRALDRLAKRHPEFRDTAVIDQSQHIHLPDGTTLEDLRRLRAGLG